MKGRKQGFMFALMGNENLKTTLKRPLTSPPLSMWPNCYSPVPHVNAVTRPCNTREKLKMVKERKKLDTAFFPFGHILANTLIAKLNTCKI